MNMEDAKNLIPIDARASEKIDEEDRFSVNKKDSFTVIEKE